MGQILQPHWSDHKMGQTSRIDLQPRQLAVVGMWAGLVAVHTWKQRLGEEAVDHTTLTTYLDIRLLNKTLRLQ